MPFVGGAIMPHGALILDPSRAEMAGEVGAAALRLHAACVAAGMRVMRMNFSHATFDEANLRLTNIRAAPGQHARALLPPVVSHAGEHVRVCLHDGVRARPPQLQLGVPRPPAPFPLVLPALLS